MASPVKVARQLHDTNGFTERVTRGRGSLLSRKPDTEQYALSAQVGNIGWHTAAGEEIDSVWTQSPDPAWLWESVGDGYKCYFAPNDDTFDSGQIIRYVHPTSGEQVTFQTQQLQWTNDLNQISPIADPANISPTSLVDDTIRYNNAFGPGIDFLWHADTVLLKKELHINALTNLPTPPAFIISGGNPVLRLQFIFQRSSGVEIYIDDVLWNEKSNNPLQTTADVEFRLASTGEVLWKFRYPVAHDADMNKPALIAGYRASAQNLFVDVRVPWSWLETAVYPVIIDPTIDTGPAAGADDGRDNTAGSFDDNNTSDRIGQAAGQVWSIWVVFDGAVIPSGATITTSYAELEAAGNDSGVGTHNIYAVNEATAVAPTSDGDWTTDHANHTTNSISWQPGGGAVTDATRYQSGSLNAVIQEIVDDNGGVTGVHLHHDGIAGQNDWFTRLYESAAADAPSIYIEYTTGGGGNPWYAYAQQ